MGRLAPSPLLTPAGIAWIRPLGILALWLAATLGLRPLAVPDEGRYADVARQMVLTGDWLVPRLDGLPFFHKPPLMYWIDAAGFAVLGVHTYAARLAPAIGAWLLGAALWYAIRRWQRGVDAGSALLVLATSPLYFLSAQYANLDMLVAGTLSVCIVAFARSVDPPGAQSLRWLVAAWALAGASVLAKGLIGVVLPAIVVLPWLSWQRRWRDLLWALHPLGLAVFAVVTLPWCIAMQQRYPGFYDYFIVEQHFRRYAQSTFNSGHGAWFYPVVLVLGTLPWSVWAWAAARRYRTGWAPSSGAERRFAGLCVCWVAAILAFFSLPYSKLIGYVLPVLLPWSWWLAGSVRRASERALRAALFVALIANIGTIAALAVRPLRSTADVAAVLAPQLRAADRVVFVDEYFYDLPFDARLNAPVIVASDWADPALPLHDNWRKELADAGRFDLERARALLWPIGQLGALACGRGTTWFVAEPSAAAQVAAIDGVALVFDGCHARLFSVPPRRCPSSTQ